MTPLANCPKCQGIVRRFTTTSDDMFCLDCDWDTLIKPAPDGLIPVDAEWYLMTYLRVYRKWKDSDFESVTPDWSGASGRDSYPGAYYHRQTVEAHEATPLFQSRLKGNRQRPVPPEKRIDTLAWTVCIRGDELIASGWDIELVGKLTPYKNRKWRKLRLFVLADLKDIAKDQPPLLGWKGIRKKWKRLRKQRRKAEKAQKKKEKRLLRTERPPASAGEFV